MWKSLTKLWTRESGDYVQQQLGRLDRLTSLPDKTSQALELLEERITHGFSMHSAQTITVQCVFENLGDFNDFLSSVNPLLMVVKTIPNDRCRSVAYDRVLETLFTHPEGYYLPVTPTVTTFVRESKKMSDCLAKFEVHAQALDPGTESYNYRVLEKTLVSIYTVTVGLLRANRDTLGDD